MIVYDDGGGDVYIYVKVGWNFDDVIVVCECFFGDFVVFGV